MTKSLPANPSLEHLKKEAKSILKAHKNGDSSCCDILRHLHQFKGKSDAEIFNAQTSLQEVQFALAMEYGFKNWNEMKEYVEEQNPLEEHDKESQKLLDEIITHAVKERAKDIHIEPALDDVRVRYRIDGVLHEMKRLPRELGLAVINDAMGMCVNPDIKDVPQDGRIKLKVENRKIDVRLSVSPTIHGCVLAMRVLDSSQTLIPLGQLGMEPEQLELYKEQINSSNGLIFVSGPVGCGKTTTLYATLMEISNPQKKIMTVEDPVEFAFEHIDQIPVRPEKGLNFSNALRSAFRQAPDVIMAGETRDLQTAELLVNSSLTGRLAFSALHTNDGPDALMRIINMGLEPFLVAESIKCVVAQRLVRLICENCKTEYKPEPEELALLQMDKEYQDKPLYRGAGCSKCNHTGYKGRTGVFSILEMTSSVAQKVLKKDIEAIHAALRKSGWTTLREAAIRKMLKGETTPEDVLKITN